MDDVNMKLTVSSHVLFRILWWILQYCSNSLSRALSALLYLSFRIGIHQRIYLWDLGEVPVLV